MLNLVNPAAPFVVGMDLVTARGARAAPRALYPWIGAFNFSRRQSFPTCPRRLPSYPNFSLTTTAKKRDSTRDQQILKQATIQENEDEEGLIEEFAEDLEDDEILLDDNEDFEDDSEAEDADIYVGDGGGGGGISLAGTSWDKEALAIAEDVSISFGGDLKVYAFKTSANYKIYLRIEKLSSKYGSPSMSDMEAFSSAYQARLDEAVLAGTIPEDLSLEVSSPGVERVIRVPEDLERFKDAPMFVKYIDDIGSEAGSPQEKDGVFKLLSFDLESRQCTWGIADVKVNRQKAGKGRPLNKKQREWRLETSFESLRLVRKYSDC